MSLNLQLEFMFPQFLSWFLTVMDQRCDTCMQLRPCCRKPLLELREQEPSQWKPLKIWGHVHQTKFVHPVAGDCCHQPELREQTHQEKFIHPVKGPIKDAWGIGSVWVTCCRAYYGLHLNRETSICTPIFLGNNEKQALSRMNHVKSFLHTSPVKKDVWAPCH